MKIILNVQLFIGAGKTRKHNPEFGSRPEPGALSRFSPPFFIKDGVVLKDYLCANLPST